MAKLLWLSCCGSVVVVQLLWISCGSVVVAQLWFNCCGSVGGMVSSDTRDPLFKSRHQPILFSINCIKNYVEKTRIKK